MLVNGRFDLAFPSQDLSQSIWQSRRCMFCLGNSCRRSCSGVQWQQKHFQEPAPFSMAVCSATVGSVVFLGRRFVCIQRERVLESSTVSTQYNTSSLWALCVYSSYFQAQDRLLWSELFWNVRTSSNKCVSVYTLTLHSDVTSVHFFCC